MTTSTIEKTGRRQAPPLRQRPQGGLGVALIGKEEEELLLDVVRRKEPFRYYGLSGKQPPMAATLEKEFAEKMGSKFALAVSSGTAALETALAALGVGPGDEVILPAYSWISCFTAVVRVGALPVLGEMDETFCLAPGEITRLANERTKVVMIVHYQGVAGDLDALLAEAHAKGLKVLEDCAESTGAIYHGKRIGTWGDIGIFSFQNQKSMTCGEGGMVITDDPILFERAVRMHDIGNLRPYHRQQIEPQVTQFAGSQFRMSELQAAMALAQLRKLDGLREHCRAIQAQIVPRIEKLPELQLRRIPDPKGDSGIEIYFCLRDSDTAAEFRRRLTELNVNCEKMTGTYSHYAHDYCKQAQAHAPAASPFKDFAEWPAKGYREEDFPRTNDLAGRFVALPLGVLYTDEDAQYIAACVESVYDDMFGA